MAKSPFDSRKLMELAVEVMRRSRPEPRADGKASPVVGAVLYRGDGSIDTAYRCELRDGDHAEYTLLERKNRDRKLDDAMLFATLEPCAPGARRHPKLGCAERIILARIKRVWVGIEDPDPTVDRKGIKYLQDSGIDVQMFDRDLQEQIREANQEFLARAVERAATAADEVKRQAGVSLSPLEAGADLADLQDLSAMALERYRLRAGIEEPVGSPGFSRRLIQQGLLRGENGQLLPTGFGVLLFGTRPRDVMPQAGVLATLLHPNGQEEVRDFAGPMVLLPDELEEWLRGKLPNTIDRSRMQRQDVAAPLFQALREAVVNALVHRDYEVAGAKIQLVVSPETIVVQSPGRPLAPITLGQLQEFRAPMLSRNPVLHYVFARMGLAEERGLGMSSLRSLPARAGLPLPQFRYEPPYLILTIFRSAVGVVQVLAPEALESLTQAERAGWEFLVRQQRVTTAEYAREFGLTDRTAQRHLSRFVRLGLLQRVGAGPSTAYTVSVGNAVRKPDIMSG